ncbi:MAG TPA: ABC transporter permease [Spirochaetota bacterium]|nr:ABC transporter permease [Spirochaetota bacterium]HPQ53458.1 ABC transporter permease [Spirochaetota bacterium]
MNRTNGKNNSGIGGIMRAGILKSMIVKEFKQMFRDTRMRIVLFVPPVMMLFLFGYAVSTDVTGVRMAVLDEDRSQTSRAFIERFTATEYFVPYAYLRSPREVTPLLDRGEVELFLHVEKGFSSHIRSGEMSSVQIVVDGTDSSRAAVVVSYVNAITSDFSTEFFLQRIRSVVISKMITGIRFRQNIALEERIMFNPDLSSRNFYLPGILGLLISLIAVTMTSMSVVKEREVGTMDQIVVSPIRPMEFIMGKSIPYTVVSFVDIVLITLLTIFWFNVPFNGSFIFLMLSSLVFILTSISVGLFISTISRTQQQAILSTFLYFLPSILLSGFIFPVYSMPESMQIIAYINPMTYFIAIVRGVFLRGVGIVFLWKELAILIIMGILLFLFSSRRFREGLE